MNHTHIVTLNDNEPMCTKSIALHRENINNNNS